MNNQKATLSTTKENQSALEHYVTESIISNIREYRIAYGISQRELSRRTGVTQNIISRMESGLTIPHLSTLMKLLEALNLNIKVSIGPK